MRGACRAAAVVFLSLTLVEGVRACRSRGRSFRRQIRAHGTVAPAASGEERVREGRAPQACRVRCESRVLIRLCWAARVRACVALLWTPPCVKSKRARGSCATALAHGACSLQPPRRFSACFVFAWFYVLLTPPGHRGCGAVSACGTWCGGATPHRYVRRRFTLRHQLVWRRARAQLREPSTI